MPGLELAPVPFNKLLILMLYCYSGDEYFFSGIAPCGDLAIERNVGGLIKYDSCIIENALFG